MLRASKNLCFLISLTVVNVLIYVAISGNFLGLRRSDREPKLNSMRRLAADGYQDRISQLVKEAVREHGVSSKNLTEMLQKAISEHSATEHSSEGDTFIHVGRSDAVNRTSGSSVVNKENPARQPGVLADGRPQSSSVGKQFPDETQKQADIAPEELAQKEPAQKDPAQKEPAQKEPAQMEPAQKEPAQKEPDSQVGMLIHVGNVLDMSRRDGEPVVFPHDYNLVINEPHKCKHDDGSDKPVFFLVLIMSIHKNFDQRNAIRRTWGSPTEVDGKKIVTLFLLAKNTNPSHQRLVEQESMQYHDLLMEDFIDTYKNLTLKSMMAMKWASTFCPSANFVMKTDDDMYVNYAYIINYLSKPLTPPTSYVTGFVIHGGPIRDPKSKWYMPRDVYPGSKYPPFCSGTGYMMSGDMPRRIFEMSLTTPFLYLEDVYVAICLDKLHVLPVNHKSFNNWRTPYSYCKYKSIFTTHMVTPTEMNRIWADQKTVKGYHCHI